MGFLLDKALGINKNKDTLLVPLSDMHSGGSTALFPGYHVLANGYWQFKHTQYAPTARQTRMFEHFMYCATEIKKMRENKRIVLVINGDATEGVHHNTVQVAVNNIDEQADIHIFLMKLFMKEIGFQKNKGDLLYYVSGTESHTNDVEDDIAKELGAEIPQYEQGAHAFDFLEIEINGKLIWFTHQGASPGKSVSLGDPLRNWLKSKYFELIEAGKRVPDLVASGHYHVPVYNTYVRNTPKYFTMHGMILPSFQLKTRFANKRASTESERVGITPIDIFSGGYINVREPMLMAVEDYVIKI